MRISPVPKHLGTRLVWNGYYVYICVCVCVCVHVIRGRLVL